MDCATMGAFSVWFAKSVYREVKRVVPKIFQE